MFCGKCGQQMSARAKFCSACGEQNISTESLETNVSEILPPEAKPATNVREESTFSLIGEVIEGAQSIWGLIVLAILILGGIGAFIGTLAPSPETAIVATSEAEQRLADAKAARLAEDQRAALSDSDEVLAAFETAKNSKQISKLGAFYQNYPESQNRSEAAKLAEASLRRQKSTAAKRVYKQYFGQLPDDMKPAPQTAYVKSSEPKLSQDSNQSQAALDFNAARLNIERLMAEQEDENNRNLDDSKTYEEVSYDGPRDMDGRPHGIGKMVFEEGTLYEGRFEHGEKILGKTTFPDGSHYTGGYRGSYPHGEGI